VRLGPLPPPPRDRRRRRPRDTPYCESWLAALGSLLAALPLPGASTGDAAEVVHRADAALYRAKRQRRRVVES
jgi:hypothetical protein